MTIGAKLNLVCVTASGRSHSHADAEAALLSPDIELVQPRGVVARHLSAVVVRHAVQDALEDRPRLREGRLGVRVVLVRAPHDRVDADELAIANAEAVFLEREEHVAVKEIGCDGRNRSAPPVRCHGGRTDSAPARRMVSSEPTGVRRA